MIFRRRLLIMSSSIVLDSWEKILVTAADREEYMYSFEITVVVASRINRVFKRNLSYIRS